MKKIHLQGIKLHINRKKRYPQRTRIFYAIWAIYNIVSIVLQSEVVYMYSVGKVNLILQYLTTAALFLLMLMNKRYGKTQFFKHIVFLFLIFCMEIKNSDKALLVYALFIINAKNIKDFRSFMSYDIKIKLFVFLSIVSASFLGVLNNYTSTFYGTTIKQAFGFAHPNTFSFYALTIIIEWLAIRYLTMKPIEWLFCLLSFLLVYFLGGGRTSSYVFIFIYLLFFIARLHPQTFKKKYIRVLFTCATPIMASLSFIGTYLYSKGNIIALGIDKFLSSRLRFAALFFREYKIPLLGQHIETVVTRRARLLNIEPKVLDNAYAYCLLVYGVIFFILFIVIYMLMTYRFTSTYQIGFALMTLFFIINGIGEYYMVSPIYNVTLLFFFESYSISRSIKDRTKTKELISEPNRHIIDITKKYKKHLYCPARR